MRALSRFVIAPALVAAAALTAASPAQPQTPASARSAMMIEGAYLTVLAEGRTQIAPDIATINVGVVTQASKAETAVAQNTAKMNTVMAALRTLGIAERDIQTANLSVNPQYTYAENQPPRLRGYEANNQVRVKVRDLKNVGKAVDAVVADGSNQVNGIAFSLNDDTKALDMARTDAVKKARARAEIYAAAAGLKVDRILAISEAGAEGPQPFPVMVTAQRMNAPPPVSPGELDLTLNVTVTFALK